MNRGHHLVHESSPVQQMMATGNPNCLPWSLNNNITPSTIAQFHEQKSQASVPPSSSISPFYPAFSSSSVPLAPPHQPPPTTTAAPSHQLLMNYMPSSTGISSASSSLPFLGAAASSSSSFWGNLTAAADSNQQEQQLELWNQLLMGAGLIMNGEEKGGQGLMNHLHQFQTIKKTENWEDHHNQVLGIHHQHQRQAASPSPPSISTVNGGVDHVKQENSGGANSNYVYGTSTTHDCSTEEFQAATAAALKQITTSAAAWSPHQQMMPVSSPQSCVTTFSNNNSLLDFSSPISDARQPPAPPQDRSSECNSTGNNTTSGGSTKRAKVQPSSTQSPIKVRKEKLGDRITALHQLVSPFGKTDTASVLLEALGYIRFLHNQIEALSLPYLTNNGSGNNNTRQPQTTVQQGDRNSIFPEEPGQLLNNKCLKRKGGPDALQESQEGEKNDLKSRGLCLVPISCTLLVGSDNGADYWAPASSPLCPGFR